MYCSFCSLFGIAVKRYHRFLSFIKTKNNTVSFLSRYTVLTGFIVLTACNSTPQTKLPNAVDSSASALLIEPTILSTAEIERLRVACESWYDSVLKLRGFNGGIVVAKKGNIVFEAYNGSGRPGGTDTITDNTSFHIASVSKTFTAMAVLKLWQDGKLNIDDEFSKYFPLFNYPGVTIRSMLSHRSGLPNYIHFMDNMGWNKRIYVTNQDVLDFLIARKPEIVNIGLPNRGFAYCNTNFALLALLIEKTSGLQYGDYLKQTFFTPLGMNHSFVYNNTVDSGKVTMSYDWRGKVIPLNFLDMVYGDKNVYSTPRDLLTWDRALTGGKLLNQKILEEAYAPYSNEKPGIRNYGLGWRMNIYPSGKKMIYHNGWWHGNNAAFIRLLQDSATIVVLGNKYDRGIYHAKDLANLFGNYFGEAGEEEGTENAVVAPVVKNTRRVPAKRGHQKAIGKKMPAKKTVAHKKVLRATAKKKALTPGEYFTINLCQSAFVFHSIDIGDAPFNINTTGINDDFS